MSRDAKAVREPALQIFAGMIFQGTDDVIKGPLRSAVQASVAGRLEWGK